MLQTTIDGQQHTARAWVAVPELLEAQVTSRARQRWEGHLVSDDPTIQAEGIAALLDQILRDLSRGGEEETAASGSVRPHTESHREESRRFRSALEVFQPAREPVARPVGRSARPDCAYGVGRAAG
jgi:hypothetical protein